MKGSPSGYQSSEGVGGNYMSGLSNIVGGITSQGSSFNKCPLSFEGNLTAKLSGNVTNATFSADINKFLSGNNNPVSYGVCMQNAYLEKLNSLKEIAKTKAIAYQGFIGTGMGGNIVYPGSAVAAKFFNVENMGNQVIANANGIAEVITSAVMKMTMDAMNNGIGNIQAQIQKGASNASGKLNTQSQNQSNNFGPGAMFGNSSMPTPPGLPGLP
jgi:hypothetical protein